MQSKISSFKLLDKALLKRNLTRFWPFTAVYTFFILWMMPGIEYFDLKLSYFETTSERTRSFLRDVLYDQTTIALWTAFFACIILALCVFGYLQSERSCYFYHSLPVTREQLFFTSLASGLIMLYVPNLIAFALSIIVASSFSISAVGAVSTWFLIICVEELFFLSFATLCMIMTGNSVVSVFIYVIFNFLAEVMIYPINGIYSNQYYGINNDFIRLPGNSLGIIYPTAYAGHLRAVIDEYNVYYVEHLGTVLGTYAVAAVILFALSLLIYNKRKSENSGDIIAIRFLRPLFRWGFGISLSLLLTWMINDSVFPYNNFSLAKQIANGTLFVILAFVGYIAAEMIMMKSVRVIKKLGFRLVVFSAVMIVGSTVMTTVGRKASLKVPEVSDIETVAVNLEYRGTDFSNPEAIEMAVAMHQYLVDNYDDIVDCLSDRNYSNYFYFEIDYSLKNGKYIARSYFVPVNYREICEMAQKFGDEYLQELIFGDSKRDDFVRGSTTTVKGSLNEVIYIELSAEECSKLYDAVLKDIEEGNLTFVSGLLHGNNAFEYNPIPSEDYTFTAQTTKNTVYEDLYPMTIEFEIRTNNTQNYSYSYLYKYLEYDEKCVNIINCIQSLNSYKEAINN